MTYRLIALDLDGTLFGDGRTFSPRARQAIAGAQARGAHVTLATGRSFTSTRPFAEELKITAPLVLPGRLACLAGWQGVASRCVAA
jgi:hypothetical protein